MVDMTKYKFYNYTGKPEVDGGKKTVCAASTYAGKTVKGYAKCDPKDNFNMEAGKALAAARCNAKIAEKRLARAKEKVIEASTLMLQAENYYDRMMLYYNDSVNASDAAKMEIENLLNEM